MKSRISVFLLGFLLSACIYENDEVFVSPVKPPNGAGSAINLDNVQEPIVIHKPTQFHFWVNPLNKREYAAEVRVGGLLMHQLTSSTGEFYFTIDPARTGDGTKEMAITATYLSLSPSLAGQLGLETITFSKQWSITIATAVPSPIPAPLVYMEDGKSMVEWTLPDKFTFTELIIFRQYDAPGNDDYRWRDSIKIQDHHSTLFHDASYVGGPVTYRIDLKGYGYYVRGGETKFNITPFKFSVDSLANPTVVTWDKSPLYNNDISLQLGGINHPPDQAGSMASELRFGQPSSLGYTVGALHPPPSYLIPFVYESRVLICRGLRVGPYQSMEYRPAENAYLRMAGNKLYKIDATTFSVMDSLQFQYNGYLVVSANKQYVYDFDSKMYEVDAEDMTVTRQIDLSTIVGPNQGLDSPTLSDNDILTCTFGAILKAFAIDLTTKQVVWQHNGSVIGSAPASPTISPDGNYIHFKGVVYERGGGQWSSVLGTVSVADDAFTAFYRQNNSKNELIVLAPNSYTNYVYDLDQAPDVNGILNPISSIPSTYKYDKYGDSYWRVEYLWGEFGNVIVYDADTYTEVQQLDEVFYPGRVQVINGHYFHYDGYYLP